MRKYIDTGKKYNRKNREKTQKLYQNFISTKLLFSLWLFYC
jgi:hypothetical protein